MKFALAMTFALLCAEAANAITMETVPVGDVGNPPQNGVGGVNYAYHIGKYEVTIGQYTDFLNAIASTDTYSLYNTAMATDINVAGISRAGASGNYSYSIIGSANHPITYVSWGDAARFANWLHNGQPTGAQGPGTTETGAYTLNGATSNSALMAVNRNASAIWFIPTSDNEWYKAAYYQPAVAGGDSDGYWVYAMRTNNAPYSDQPPGATPNNTRVGNFYKNDGIANGYDDGFAVTGLPYNSSQNYLTDVGAYSFSPSYYGTFDQGGNVFEWNETASAPSGATDRATRGGSWHIDYIASASSGTYFWVPTTEKDDIGFRVASIAEQLGIGDYTEDRTVDAADYVLWRMNVRTGYGYSTWRANFGTVVSGTGSTFNQLGVPEPHTVLLLGLAALTLGIHRRSRGRPTH
jgi:formylglycine-generating enzyme